MPILKGHLCYKEKLALLNRWPFKRGSIQFHMKFSIALQEKVDLLIQVTA
jgi:hypothetical protein